MGFTLLPAPTLFRVEAPNVLHIHPLPQDVRTKAWKLAWSRPNWLINISLACFWVILKKAQSPSSTAWQETQRGQSPAFPANGC